MTASSRNWSIRSLVREVRKRAGASTFRRNVSWQFVATISQTALSGLLLLLLGRSLGASGFGQFSVIVSFITVANTLMEPRMQDVAARLFWNLEPGAATQEIHRKSFADLMALEALAKLLPMIAVTLLSIPLTKLARLPPDSALLITIASIGNYLAKAGYGVSIGVLRVLGRGDQITLCGSGELLLRLGVLLALASLTELTVAASIITMSITLALGNLVLVWIALRHFGGLSRITSGWRLHSMPRRVGAHRRLLLSNVGLSAVDLMSKDLDVTLLSSTMPAASIGVYKMAKNIALLTWRAIDPFYLSLMPELNRRVQAGDLAGTHRLIKGSAIGLGALSMCLSTITMIGVWLFGGHLLGAEFSGITGLLGWMLFGVVFGAPLVWGHPLVIALNRAELALLGNVFSLALGLVALIVLVGTMGIRGAAIAWSLAFLPFFLVTSLPALRLLRQLRMGQHA